MKYEWDSSKNQWLKVNRNISFEEIIFHLGKGDLWRIADHPNQERYPGQKIYFVIVDDYIYMVLCITEKDYVFLKTIIPSKAATKDFKKETGKEGVE